MEIEAKFELIRADTGQYLATSSTLGPFRLGSPELLHVTDVYIDTPQQDCQRQGYECRLRTLERGAVVTLKQLASDATQGGVIFRREEYEQPLSSASVDPSDWESGPARDLAQRLSPGRPFLSVLTLYQDRLVRSVFDGDREIGELTVDRVRTENVESPDGVYSVVEVELRPQGTEDDLRIITKVLMALPGLSPASESKFAHGMALLRAAKGT